MSKAPKDLRIPIMMSSSEVEAIDNWRFENHIATRAGAVRRLCQMGLGVDEYSQRSFDWANNTARDAELLHSEIEKFQTDPTEKNKKVLLETAKLVALRAEYNLISLSQFLTIASTMKIPVSGWRTPEFKQMEEALDFQGKRSATKTSGADQP